jgi:hypothetical protein
MQLETNKRGELNLLGQAILFVILFIIGGIIGVLALPEFVGRFYISGLIFSIFGLGFGNVIIHWHHHSSS